MLEIAITAKALICSHMHLAKMESKQTCMQVQGGRQAHNCLEATWPVAEEIGKSNVAQTIS